MNYKIIVQYDGTRYDGWQRLGHTKNTIQGKLEEILSKHEGKTIEIHGAGRTDAGVHALGQVAHFHLEEEVDCKELLHYMNQYLPHDIGVLSVSKVSNRFHSRLLAKSKVYRYQIMTSKAQGVFNRKYAYLVEESLDLERMKEACKYLIGTHDFKSFCSNKKLKKSSTRTIYSIDIEQKEDKIFLILHGNGFLYNMVRIIVGTLLEVGKGIRTPKEIQEILEAKDRTKAGVTAPAQGLFLDQVFYEEHALER